MVGNMNETQTPTSVNCRIEGCKFAKMQLYSTAVADVILKHHLASVHQAKAHEQSNRFLTTHGTPGMEDV
jgi:hypothetical protein